MLLIKVVVGIMDPLSQGSSKKKPDGMVAQSDIRVRIRTRNPLGTELGKSLGSELLLILLFIYLFLEINLFIYFWKYYLLLHFSSVSMIL